MLKIKVVSVRIIEKLLITTKLGLKQIMISYRFEVLKREVWLLSIEDCIMMRLKPSTEEKAPRKNLSVVSLAVNSNSQQAYTGPLLPRPASRFFKNSKTRKEQYLQAQSKHFGWGHASGSSFLLDSSFVRLQQSRESTPKPSILPEVRSSSQPLKTNELAFKDAAFVEKQVKIKNVSKLNSSYSGKEIRKEAPILGFQVAHTAVHSGSRCWGKFCQTNVDTGNLPYSDESRFMVSAEVINAAKDFSPPPRTRFDSPVKSKSRRIGRHSKHQSEMMLSLSVNKLIAKAETAQLPVCLKCFILYENLKTAMKESGLRCE